MHNTGTMFLDSFLNSTTTQLMLAALLGFASASACTQQAATPLKTLSTWSPQEAQLLRLTKRVIHASFLRHVGVTLWSSSEVWSSNGKASATFGNGPSSWTGQCGLN